MIRGVFYEYEYGFREIRKVASSDSHKDRFILRVRTNAINLAECQRSYYKLAD